MPCVKTRTECSLFIWQLKQGSGLEETRTPLRHTQLIELMLKAGSKIDAEAWLF